MSADDASKARILDLYENGEITENAARALLGEEEFEDAELMAQGAEVLLSRDPERYIS